MRGLGHKPDPAAFVELDLHRKHIRGLVGAVSPRPIELDYAPRLDAVPDQKASSACVGHALSTATLIRSDIAGHRIARPSRMAIYTLARLSDQPYASLIDEGSMPRSAVLGMQTYGLVADERWPLEMASINSLPPLDVFGHGLAATIADYYRIESGPGCAETIRQALAKGFLPCIALQVDPSFMNYTGGVYGAVNGPIIGGHYLACIGYGDGWIRVCNSWTASWGEGGFGRIADAVIDSNAVSDVLVVTTTPAEVS